MLKKTKRIVEQVVGNVKPLLNLDETSYIRFLKDYFGNKPIVIAEIGVFKGDNALKMLKHLNIKKIYLIDLWGSISYEEGDLAGKSFDWEQYYEIAKKNLEQYKSKTKFIRSLSVDGVNYINEQLDAIYIDCNHDYKAVLEDVRTYYPIVKMGGVIGGHDFCPRYPGVARAVNEFFDYPKMICRSMNCEWWIIKK